MIDVWDLLTVTGIGLATYGAWLVDPKLGFVMGGALCFVVGILGAVFRGGPGGDT